jgi:hypothetical protein
VAKDSDRFVWAMSFLDLFTCALGGVFVLTLLSVRERAELTANDPGGYLFLTAHFATKVDPSKLEVKLPAGFEPAKGNPRWSADGRFVVIATRIPYGETLDEQAGAITLPGPPSEVRGGTELGSVEGVPPPPLKGRRYVVTVGWAPTGKPR